MKQARKFSSYVIPSIADILFLSVFLYLAFSIGQGLLNDADAGWHIRVGEYVLNTRSVPRYDIFSFITPPIPWTAHEWLAEVVMAMIHQNFGLTGIALFFSFMISMVYYLLFKMLRTCDGNILIAVLVAVLVIVASPMHWLARPHVFTQLFLIIWYIVLDGYQSGKPRRYLLVLPMTMLLWVNMHGGFIIGFFLLGIYLIGNILEAFFAQKENRLASRVKVRELGVVVFLCLFACLANPRGYHLLLFPFNVVGNKYLMDHVVEFISPNFHEPLMVKYLLFMLIGLLALSRKRLSAIELLLIIVFLNMALFSIRHVPLFALVMAPIIVRQATAVFGGCNGRFANLVRKKGEGIAAVDASARGVTWLVAGVAAVALCAATGMIHFGFNPKIKPVAAVEFLQREPIQGNMFNNDQIGGYIIYAAHQRYKVFFDGRSDMYGVERMKEYNKVMGFEPGWEKVLEKYRITWIIFDAKSMLSRFLLSNDHWRLIYADKVANIFVKDIPEYRYLLDKYKDVKPLPHDYDDKSN